MLQNMLIRLSHTNDETYYEPPDRCRTCGFPDFEEGCGYFTGDNE